MAHRVCGVTGALLLSLTLSVCTGMRASALTPPRRHKAKAHAQAAPLTAKQIFERYNGAVVHIETDRGEGTGFFVANGLYIVTCCHVIAGAKHILIKDYQGNTIPISKISLDSNSDSALIITAVTQKHPSLDIFTKKPTPGDNVFVIGNPLGFLTNSITTGILSGTRTEDGVDLLQFTAPISPGNSGSPLIDDTGHALGFVSFTFTRGQSLNMAVYLPQVLDAYKRGFRTLKAFYADNAAAVLQDAGVNEEGGAVKNPASAVAAYAAYYSNVVLAWQALRIQMDRIAEETDSPVDAIDALRIAEAKMKATLSLDSLTSRNPEYHSAKVSEANQAALSALKELTAAYEAEIREYFNGTAESMAEAHKKSVQGYRDTALALASLLQNISKESWFDTKTFSGAMPNTTYALMNGKFYDIMLDPDVNDQAAVGWGRPGTLLKRGDIIVGIATRDDQDFTTVQTWRDVADFQLRHPDQGAFKFTLLRGGTPSTVTTDLKRTKETKEGS